MELKRFRNLIIAGVLTCNAASPLPLARCEEKVESSSSPVRQMLSQECLGRSVDRRELLNAAATDSARWHAGQVQRDGRWVDVDDLSAQSDSEREYEQLRSKMNDDASSHRKLAKWCQRNHLPMQAQAHWHAVIDKLPNDLEARRQLGHQFIDGTWFTEQEIRSAAETSRERIADLKRWNPQVSSVLKMLTQGDSRDKQAAIRKLNDMHDPSSIASLEMAALQSDDDVAKLMVDRISQHHNRTACVSLARIALADPYSARGVHATKKLKEYDQSLMVPELLGLLSTPVETRIQYGLNQRGELVLDRVMFRETQDRRELVQLQRVVRTNLPGLEIETARARFAMGAIESTRANRPARGTSQTLIDEQVAGNMAADDQAQFEREIAEVNRREESKSRDVRHVLAEVTGQPADMSAEQWWKWWQAKNYRPVQAKPLALRQYQQVDQPQLTVNSYSHFIPPQDCLVAGTLVQTSTGNRPIESIERGDLVLSQNIETGRLDLKPVIRVVPRDPGTIIVIQTESDQIRSTQGHRWWVAGKGWVMAADLEAGMNLHTASGTVRITEVREDAEQPTFNLVVDEYHTYFVGKDRVLSFDNIEPRPTLKKVPGFDEK